MAASTRNMKTILLADWGPAMLQIARRAAAVVVAVYTAGYVTGLFVHGMNQALAAAWRALLGAPPRGPGGPGGPGGGEPAAPAPAPAPALGPTVIEKVVECRMPAPAQALALRRKGLSQERIARALGVSRWKARQLLAMAAMA